MPHFLPMKLICIGAAAAACSPIDNLHPGSRGEAMTFSRSRTCGRAQNNFDRSAARKIAGPVIVGLALGVAFRICGCPGSHRYNSGLEWHRLHRCLGCSEHRHVRTNLHGYGPAATTSGISSPWRTRITSSRWRPRCRPLRKRTRRAEQARRLNIISILSGLDPAATAAAFDAVSGEGTTAATNSCSGEAVIVRSIGASPCKARTVA